MRYTPNIRSTALLCLLTLIAGLAQASNNGGPNGKPFITLNDQIVEVQGEISSIQDQIDLLVGRVDSMEAKVTANTTAVAQLESISAALQVLVDQNLSDVTAIQNEIAAIEVTLADLNLQIATASGDITTLEQAHAENVALLGQLQAALLAVEGGVISLGDSLQAQVDNNAQLIAALQQEIASIGQVQTFQANLAAGSCPDGSAVVDIQADGTYVCAGSGGGTGASLESRYFIQNMTLPASGYVYSYAYCPSGWVATGAGFIAQWDVRMLGSYAQVDWGFFSARNMASYSVPVFNILTCIRL